MGTPTAVGLLALAVIGLALLLVRACWMLHRLQTDLGYDELFLLALDRKVDELRAARHRPIVPPQRSGSS